MFFLFFCFVSFVSFLKYMNFGVMKILMFSNFFVYNLAVCLMI